MALKMFSKLSPPRQRLVEIIQSLGFGVIDLDVIAGEPCFEPPPKVVQDIKIGGNSESRGESVRRDFALTSKMVELFEHIDRLTRARVVIEVKHAQPFRLTVECAHHVDGRSATEHTDGRNR